MFPWLRLGPFLEKEGGADGGEGEPEGSENLNTDGNAGDGSDGEPNEGQSVPYERFAKVNAEAKTAKEMLAAWAAVGMSPAQVQAELARLKELGAESPYTPTELKEITDKLMAVPAFRRVHEFMESQRQEREGNTKSYIASMKQKVGTYMKENLGLDIKDEAQRKKAQLMVEGILAETIRMSPELIQRWNQGDKSVIEDAIKESQVLLGGLRRTQNSKVQGNKAQSRPPLRSVPAPAGQPVKDEDPRDVERRTLDKAAEKGFEILQAREAQG